MIGDVIQLSRAALAVILFPCYMPNSFIYYFSFRINLISDCCFAVQVPKGPRGLGLSVSGGVDTNAAFPGLIRIKRLFPNQSAWCTGLLQPGDILLEANGTPLTGLTNHVICFFLLCIYFQRFVGRLSACCICSNFQILVFLQIFC